jgi:hypothetical protein
MKSYFAQVCKQELNVTLSLLGISLPLKANEQFYRPNPESEDSESVSLFVAEATRMRDSP